jgi:hypothetical protein
MLTICSEPGCSTLVMGGRCLEHERRPIREFVRGRPLITAVPPQTETYGFGVGTLAATGAVHTFDVGGSAHVERDLPRT